MVTLASPQKNGGNSGEKEIRVPGGEGGVSPATKTGAAVILGTTTPEWRVSNFWGFYGLTAADLSRFGKMHGGWEMEWVLYPRCTDYEEVMFVYPLLDCRLGMDQSGGTCKVSI